MKKVVVHWSSFGPFHLARLKAAFEELEAAGIELVGLEMTTHKKLLAWDRDDTPTPFRRYVAWPGDTFENLSALRKWQGMLSKLKQIKPDVVAINGYSDYDAWSALTWCKLYKRGAIIMSDTTLEWAPRFFYKESLKQLLVRRFNSALCAGKCSQGYLETLGMQPEAIFEGLDAIDNEYFFCRAKQARSNRNAYRSLPGLESPKPFFLASSRLSREKNLDGLIRAYSQYRFNMAKKGLSPWRLVILGDGSELSKLEYIVQSEKIDEISFAGFHQINEIPIYYGLASAFIHPTFKDTWGLVVNEAMASGLPVLVSKSAGCAIDLVNEGKNGFTFAPTDLEKLTNLMVMMSSGQIDLEMMGKAAQAHISQWGVERFSQGLCQAVKVAIR